MEADVTTSAAGIGHMPSARSQIEVSRFEYPPYGRCIYCGSTNEPLTTEHIIPYGLFGRLVIPKSSCGECQKETHQFETHCQRKLLGNFRYRSNYPSRKKKQRPKHFEVETYIESGTTNIRNIVQIPINMAPRIFMLPIFGAPMFWKNETEYPDLYFQFWGNPNDLRDINLYTGTKTMITVQVNRKSFLRMICKIAHSYLFGAVNNPDVLSGFSPLLADFIRHGEGEPQQYVGSRSEDYPVTKSSHTINVIRLPCPDKEYLVVKIRLFAYLDPQPPTYYAVTAVKNLI